MSKSYLSGAAKRQAREERAQKAAKLPKIYAFLKPVDNKLVPMTTSDMVSESSIFLLKRRRANEHFNFWGFFGFVF